MVMGKKSRSDGKLAVVVPHSGQPTETFIRRYCEQLAPGNTVLVHFYHGADSWAPDCPTFFLQDAFFGSAKLARIYRAVQKVLGIGSLFGDPYTASCLLRFFKQQHVSVVFSQYLVTAWNIHHVVRRAGLRHVVRGHGFDVSSSLDDPVWRKRYLEIQDADAFVVPSPFQVERLLSIGLQKAQIRAIPYGIDIPLDMPAKSLAKDFVDFLFVGRLVPKKAPFLLVEAFLMAAEKNPNIRLTLAGCGPLWLPLQNFLKGQPLGSFVKLLGQLEHSAVLKLMAASDVYIQHSITDSETGDQEGAPVAIMEAMANGLPIVSTRHSGIPFLVEEGASGLLSEEGSVEKMASNIAILATNLEMRLQMARSARIRAKAFSWASEKAEIQRLLG